MTDVAANFTGSIPDNYDKYLGPIIFAGYANDLAIRVCAAQPSAILELAAGTGILSRQLRDQLPDHCSIIATDLNPPMLESAKQKFTAGENLAFKAVDAVNLPFTDGSFDVVVCQFGIMFFPDKEQSCREVLRVLKPGGRYIFNVWGAWEANPFAAIAHEVVASIFPDNPPGFYKVPFGYHDHAVIRDTLLASGFKRVEIDTVTLQSDIPSAEDFARGLVYGNPLLEEILARKGNPDLVCATLTKTLQDKLGSSMPLQAVIIEAS
jgi:ubiquinone/menaquinone biosynthesis C-methylase UbiE